MGDGRLSQPQGSGEVTDTGLATLMRGDHRYQPQPGRIGQCLELARKVGRLAGVIGSRINGVRQACSATGSEGRSWMLTAEVLT